jgi:hypothetical protein
MEGFGVISAGASELSFYPTITPSSQNCYNKQWPCVRCGTTFLGQRYLLCALSNHLFVTDTSGKVGKAREHCMTLRRAVLVLVFIAIALGAVTYFFVWTGQVTPPPTTTAPATSESPR